MKEITMHVDDIVLNDEYFLVNVGVISKIKFLEISQNKTQVMWTFNGLTLECEWYLDDMGIDSPTRSYVNDLNFVFKTIEEAEEKINADEYQEALKNHFWYCDEI